VCDAWALTQAASAAQRVVCNNGCRLLRQDSTTGCMSRPRSMLSGTRVQAQNRAPGMQQAATHCPHVAAAAGGWAGRIAWRRQECARGSRCAVQQATVVVTVGMRRRDPTCTNECMCAAHACAGDRAARRAGRGVWRGRGQGKRRPTMGRKPGATNGSTRPVTNRGPSGLNLTHDAAPHAGALRSRQSPRWSRSSSYSSFRRVMPCSCERVCARACGRAPPPQGVACAQLHPRNTCRA
jgi:hypothetical protein